MLQLKANLSLAGAAFLYSRGDPAEEYTGDFKDGVPHGFGIWTHPGDARYIGQFANGLRHGHGTWTHPDGFVYLVEFRDVQYYGQGALLLPDGTKYRDMAKQLQTRVDRGWTAVCLVTVVEPDTGETGESND